MGCQAPGNPQSLNLSCADGLPGRRLVTGLALLVFCLPLVATGPILRVLLGPGDGPEIVLAALAVYYTTLVPLLVGLNAAPAAWFDLLQNPDSQPHCYGFIWFGSLMARAYDVMQLMFGSNAQGKNGLNWAYYSNPEMDSVLAEAVKEVDAEKRIALYRKAEKMIVDDSPALFLSYSKYRVPIVKEVEGYISNPMYIYTYPFNRMKFAT